MNVTRDIVKDLLPLYVAGEASTDSRAAVEAALRDDQELARLAAALGGGTVAVPASRKPAAGRAALDRTKALLRRRTWLFALALFFTGLPLSFSFDSSGLSFLLIRDAPMAGGVFFVAGAALWVALAVTTRRLRVTGL